MKTLEKPPAQLTPALTRYSISQTRYITNDILGEGGMGTVFRGIDNHLGREVAIKRLHSTEPCSRESSLDSVLHEAQMLASLNHPNIVTVHDAYETDGDLFIVMELLEGKTLNELTKSARFEMDTFSELVLQIQDALISANENGIIHGDLKPHNIIQTQLRDAKLQYKLLDFDQARLIGKELGLSDQLGTTGSTFFMAPERFEGGPPTILSDIYAMGCVYYYALTRELPCSGNTPVEVMAAHLRNDITPLSKLRPDLPKWVTQWVGWLLEKDPKARPQSPLAALTSFKSLLAQLTAVPEKITGITQPERKTNEAWLASLKMQ